MAECRHHGIFDPSEAGQSRKLYLVHDASRKLSRLTVEHHAAAEALVPGAAWVEQDGRRVRVRLLAAEDASRSRETEANGPASDRVCGPPCHPAEDGLSPAQFRRVLAFISERLSRNLSLTDLAGEAGLSAAYFSQRFKSSTGTSPHQYLLRLRICRAKTLLKESEAPIIDIAAECGFQTQQHFARIFRRLTSLTPTEYRREQQRSEFAVTYANLGLGRDLMLSEAQLKTL